MAAASSWSEMTGSHSLRMCMSSNRHRRCQVFPLSGEPPSGRAWFSRVINLKDSAVVGFAYLLCSYTREGQVVMDVRVLVFALAGACLPGGMLLAAPGDCKIAGGALANGAELCGKRGHAWRCEAGKLLPARNCPGTVPKSVASASAAGFEESKASSTGGASTVKK